MTGDAHTWLSATGALMDQTTAPHIVTTYVHQEYVRVASISPLIALLALLASVVHGLWRNDGASLVRQTATFLPLGIVATLVGPTLATLVLRLTDGLATAVSGDVASQLSLASEQITTTAPTFSMFAMTILCLLAALVLWVELVLRNIVLALLLCTMPLAVAALVWAPARRIAGRLRHCPFTRGSTSARREFGRWGEQSSRRPSGHSGTPLQDAGITRSPRGPGPPDVARPARTADAPNQ
ncbi:MAG: hypothetical protein EBR99_01505 [Actinobacteria bacterium]|nr:hypothetical protein [Actinomycetota bacterium]